MLETLLLIYSAVFIYLLLSSGCEPEGFINIFILALWPLLMLWLAYTLIREYIDDRKNNWHMR